MKTAVFRGVSLPFVRHLRVTFSAACVVEAWPVLRRKQVSRVSLHQISTLALVGKSWRAVTDAPRVACPAGPIEEPMYARPSPVGDAPVRIHATDNAWHRRAISAFNATMASVL